MPTFTVSGQIVDVVAGRIFSGTIEVFEGRIAAIREGPATSDQFLLPGFVDAHVHIESSMMVPSEFARFAVTHGTVATVSDPHEIANVLGEAGIQLMVENGRRVPFKFHFGVPSCVPATIFETAGAVLDSGAVCRLFDQTGLKYLSEMMNYPGVLHGDPEVRAKLQAAKDRGLPIDGHAPGLRGEAIHHYAAAGPSTDHECVTLAEGLDRIAAGMKVLIREGSAAKNFDALHPLLKTHPQSCMFCTDDLHPDSLAHGHIDRIVARAVALGHDLMAVLRAASLNPVRHYGLPVGLLQAGDPADFIIVDNLKDFRVLQTYIDGMSVSEHGRVKIARIHVDVFNRFAATEKKIEEFAIPALGKMIRAIVAHDGQLVTDEVHVPGRVGNGRFISDVANDVLQIAVVNRYADAPPALGFIRGFGFQCGAIAASVAHDSHNIIAVGVSDDDLCKAINAVIAARGGLAVAHGKNVDVLALEVAGLMSTDGEAAAAGYSRLDKLARDLGSPLAAPFMTLSFMALTVIPALKLSDRGLFDGKAFQFTSLYVDG